MDERGLFASAGLDVPVERVETDVEPPVRKPAVEGAPEASRVRRGVTSQTRVESIDESGPQVRVTVTGRDGTQQVLETDKVLQAIGFAPNITVYGLENTGVRVTERGAIVARNVHAHPTLGEAVKEAVHGLAGHMINM